MATKSNLTSALMSCSDSEVALDLVLEAALQLHGAGRGNVQLYNLERQVLEIVRQEGFNRDFLDFFQRVSADDACSCGRALRSGQAIVVPDLECDPDFASYLSVMRAAGVRAVQSIPLVSSTGQFVGVVSTHFREPGLIATSKIEATVSFARQTAEIILLLRAEEAARHQDASTLQWGTANLSAYRH